MTGCRQLVIHRPAYGSRRRGGVLDIVGRMMPSQLRAAFVDNDHLLTHEALLVAGVTPAELRGLVRSGAVVRVRQGVYACGEQWRTASTHAGRGLFAARAASMVMVVPHLLSHDSAAHALGLSFLAPAEPLVHVTRGGVQGSRTKAGVKHHGAPHRKNQVVVSAAGPALDVARTAVDLVREHGLRIGLGACDSALRLGVSRLDLAAAAAPMTYWRGVRAVRSALEWADPGADNPAESLARLLVLETGFGRPRTQVPVRLGERVVWCDMVVGAHVVEFDGLVKYRARADGGVADRDPAEIAWAERRRERALVEHGLGVSRLVWSDLVPGRWDATRARLRHEIGATWQRGGALLPAHVREFSERMAGERASRIWGRLRSA